MGEVVLKPVQRRKAGSRTTKEIFYIENACIETADRVFEIVKGDKAIRIYENWRRICPQ